MTRPLALLVAIAALALAGCGGDAGGDRTSAATSGAPEPGAFPVTVESRFGAATIAAAPERVVTLDNQATDDALALGVVPVGAARVGYVPGGVQTWTATALGSRPRPALLDTDTGIPYERIAALRPDLILAPHAHLLDEAAYRRLARIAPVVHFQRGALEDSWQDTLTRIGRALGRPAQARALVARAEDELAAARSRTPAFAGATVTIANVTPEGVYAINEPGDYSMRLMAGLGMRLSPGVAALRGESGRAQVSAERYDVLDADLLIATSTSPEVLAALRDDELFARVPAVRKGRYVPLPIGEATALAFPSVLSVRHAAGAVVPRLERAMGSASATASAFPVTIRHKFGTTTIPSAPRRVAAVGFTEQDTVLALGVRPVAVREFLGGYDWRSRPWATDALAGAEPAVIGREELGFERIAAVRPDLIIAINTGMSRGDYARLSRIAPTIAQVGGVVDFGMPWQDQTRMIGRALGRAAQAERLVADVEERFARARAEHPELVGATAVLAYGGPDGYGAYTSQDTRSRFLSDLGLRLPPAIDSIAGGAFYTALSAERFRLLERDVVLMYGPQEAIERDAVFGRLDAVRRDRVVYLDLADHAAGALGFSSPLSLPYLIDELVPRLAAAVDGDPATAVEQPG